jgi:sulfatase maturation enzyme AslB (radical SAM superfamily)
MKSSCCGKMHKPFVNFVPRRSVVFKKGTILLAIWAVTALFAMVGMTIAAQKEATPKAQDNVAVGEPEVKQMLPLMDQDKDGKVSKQDFMNFMEAEFDRLDKTKEGKLDVKKITQPQAQRVGGFHK